MRRRRRHLEVSTFPFLAVLLCTMGSLILLLLVLDRRAKIVALHKAREEAVQSEAARAQRDQEQAEFQRRRQQLHQALAEQELELQTKIEQARGQVAAAATRLQDEEASADRLKKDIQTVGIRVASGRQALEAQQNAVASAVRLSEEADRELHKQALALQQMEQALAGLKALRQRQNNTYSVVPYLGKRGQSRRPLYVECAAWGLVFHPDGHPLQGPQLTQQRIREEVLSRIEQLPSGKAEEASRPYLLMLVRPDGILNYYGAMAALAGLQVDFGYELIEGDWVLDFSAETGAGPPQPWMASKIPSTAPVSAVPWRQSASVGQPFVGVDTAPGSTDRPSTLGGGVPVRGQASPANGAGQVARGTSGPPPVPGLPQFEGTQFGGTGDGTVWKSARGTAGGPTGGGPDVSSNSAGEFARGGMPNGLPPVRPTIAAAPGAAGGPGNVQATGNAGPAGGTGPASDPGQATGNARTAIGTRPASDPGDAKPTGNAASAGGTGASGGPGDGQATGNAGAAGGTGASGGPGDVQATGRAGAAGSSGAAGGPGDANATANAGPAVSGSPGGGGAGGGSSSTPDAGAGVLNSPLLPATGSGAAGKQNPPPLGRVLGNRDWVLYIECHGDGIVLKYGNKRFGLPALAAPATGEHELAATVRMAIARKQATVGTGEPPYRPCVRFQVWPDGSRAYYRAYPLLLPLRIPMTRENVGP